MLECDRREVRIRYEVACCARCTEDAGKESKVAIARTEHGYVSVRKKCVDRGNRVVNR